MKTFRTFALSAISFMAIFFGLSTATAQSGNQLLDALVTEINSQPSGGMQSDGVVSMVAKAEGSVLNMHVTLDESIVPLSMFSALIDEIKAGVKENKYSFSDEEVEMASIFDASGISFQYVLKGNKSGTVLKKDVSFYDLLAMSKFSSSEGDVFENMPIKDLVALIDAGMKLEDGGAACVLKGNNVVFEIEFPKDEYDVMKQLAESNPELLDEMFSKMLLELLNEDGKAIFDSIRKRGYGFGISIKCGKNVPIFISLD